MSVLLFLLVLFILILVHEFGHFIMAKKTGMRVDEFGIGFPPKLFGVKKGETEYTFNTFPVGGFVKIWGENGEEHEEFQTAEDGENRDNDISRAFGSRPKWAQALVLVAGVTMNILFAWFLFTITFMIGIQTVVDDTDVTDSAQLYITTALPDSPANDLPAGSVVTSVSYGEEIIDSPNVSEFQSLVSSAGSDEVKIDYEFNGEVSTVSIAPVQGLLEENPDKYILGVSLAMVDVVREPFFTAIASGFKETICGLKSIIVGLYTLVVGEADFAQVSGPVGIVGMVGEAASYGVTALLTFTAIISLNLAVINLLPFPALDGGRLVFVGIEAITRKQISQVWSARVNLIGFGILMLLMVAVTYNDIVRLF